MDNPMSLEWVKTVGSIVVSWPVVGLIAILFFRKPLLASVTWLTGATIQRFKLGGFEVELQTVKDRQALQEAEIGAIQIALKGVLTMHEIDHLQGLNKSGNYLIRYEPDLYRYLHRLDGLKFIQPKPEQEHGLFTIEERHREDDKLPFDNRPAFDLKKFVYITDDGKQYLSTLNDILSKLPAARRGAQA